MKRHHRLMVLLLTAAIGSSSLIGCSNLPGTPGQQGAVGGGVGGAVIGAAVAKDNRLLGALIGGALGAGGGYLIGANWDKITGHRREDALAADRMARERPATPADVYTTTTADLNRDGFVTMDEVVAMRQANLNDQEIIRRLQATGQVFELTPEQEHYLTSQGVDAQVIYAMRSINQERRQQLLQAQGDVIGRPPSLSTERP